MARTADELPSGIRLTDHISLGVIAKTFPIHRVHQALDAEGRNSKRQRKLPAHVVVYYVIAMALFMQSSCREVLRCLLEGVQWLMGPDFKISVAGRAGISQARTRVGSQPLRRLHDEIVAPIATNEKGATTRGAWYKNWRLISIDGSTLDVADTRENQAAFNRPGTSRGKSAFPQIRFVSFVENGTHVLFGTRMGGCRDSEMSLAKQMVGSLTKGYLCLADRNFFSYALWKQSSQTQAQLLWRVKKNLKLPCLRRFRDGSYLSKIYASDKERRHERDGIEVRVVEYRLEGVAEAEAIYRLITTILNPADAPAKDMAALYHERWEIETAIGEFKTHLRGKRIVLRSKCPDLVVQEFYGFMLAHFAIRGLMHEAALKGDIDPDRLSFLHSVRVIRRKLSSFSVVSP